MDDIMPGTKPPPITVVFVDIPEHTETELGSSVLLACRTANPVAECQWSWQPLPPIHLPLPDISESPSVSTSKREFVPSAISFLKNIHIRLTDIHEESQR